jgi:hypothetical protein
MPLSVPLNAVRLSASASDQEFLTLVQQWVEALAREDYDAAYGMTAHNAYRNWTPSRIKNVIEGYGIEKPHPAGIFRVTSIKNVRVGGRPRHDVQHLEPNQPDLAQAEVWFDLPLNGEWSDLSVTFAVYDYEGSKILCLDQLKVF